MAAVLVQQYQSIAVDSNMEIDRIIFGLIVALLQLLAAQSQYGLYPGFPTNNFTLNNYNYSAFPYQNNPYQNNPYQNNPYQNNPYQNNPYQYNPYQNNPNQYYPSYPTYTTMSPYYPYGGYNNIQPTFAGLASTTSPPIYDIYGYGSYANENNKIRIWPYVIGGSYGSYFGPKLLSYLMNQTNNNYG